MHAAFGKAGSIRQAPDALLTVFTHRVENDNTLGPQSHGVGPCSEGRLTSRRKSALQSTRSTAICPALRGCPSPTYGAVTLIVISAPREEQFYVMCLDTAVSGPRLIRAWKRRHWIEYCFRTLKHLLATGACQVHSEDAYYGHLVLRLMGCLVLFYTSRVIAKGRLTMEEIIFSLKHYWRFVDSEVFELQALSWGIGEKAA